MCDRLTWLPLLLCSLVALTCVNAQPLTHRKELVLPERLQELLLLQQVLEELRPQPQAPQMGIGEPMDAVLLPPMQPQPQDVSHQQQAKPGNKKRKRTCYINAGLSHGCDYKDLVGAMAEKSYWDTVRNPGRKRRDVPASAKNTDSKNTLTSSTRLQRA